MKQHKASRKGISLDMTAMCDVAFLLLTFFILTAKMKTPEPASFEVPSSISTTKLPESNVIRIGIANDGRVFFSVAEQENRKEIIQKVAAAKNEKLTEKQVTDFGLLETFGMSVSDLKTYLNQTEEKRQKFPQRGIPCDSVTNELKLWVKAAKRVNPDYRITIKGDQNAPYGQFEAVIESMKEMGLTHFSLVTSLENKPQTL
jgi:biopolymer transport protein ExbD